MQVVQVETGQCFQAKGKGRRDAPAFVLHFVAAWIARILVNHVQPERGTVVGADDLVPVCGDTLLLAAADGDGRIQRIFQRGLLGCQVDGAGRRCTAVVGAGRPFQYVDLFNIEHVARDGAQVAHAVHIDAAGRIEAAHIDRIARTGAAVFTEEEGPDARRVAQCFRQRNGALLLYQFFLDDGDALRRVDQGFSIFWRCGLVGLEVVFLAADDFHFLQSLAAGGSRCRSRRGCHSGCLVGCLCGDRQQHHRKSGADVLVESGMRVFAAFNQRHERLSV